MLGSLTKKFQDIFATLRKTAYITEKNMSDAVREVRLALLEADVNYSVAKTFIQKVKEKALGEKVIQSVSAGQQFIKIVHDELVTLMGGNEEPLHLKGDFSVIMLCGLQGSGKTTHAAKLAYFLRQEKKCKNPLLVACDLQRPAAIEQLHTLGRQINVPVFSLLNEKNPITVAEFALQHAKKNHHDLMIVDTAGRLHVDEPLMQELKEIKGIASPQEILFVANATTGQDAVNSALEFHQKMQITGTILTMLDGNTRGGAAISIREVTGCPLKFEGVGEKIEDLQIFNPQSMADRILGMGDTINLVRKAKQHMDEDEAKSLEKKIRTATFTYDDYLKQIQTVKRMGSLKSLLGMMPGMGQLSSIDFDEGEFFKVEAIILSMTPDERLGINELSVPRRKRIAKGSGLKIDDINRLVKSFEKAKKFFKNLPNQKQLEKMMGGMKWP